MSIFTGLLGFITPPVTRAAAPRVSYYLPQIRAQQPAAPALPHLLGWYGQGFWHLNTPQDMNNLLLAADTWSGKKHSIVAFFFGLNDGATEYSFRGQLEALWQNGYTPFVNLMGPNMTAYDIARGAYDAGITAIGKSYANWANQGGGRKAFVSILPEMNGYWTTYGRDPGNFKIAYDRIRSIFAGQGAPNASAWWVFAPNGWSQAGQEFENYYPGDAKVDIVGFSSYNYGWCAVAAPYEKWDTANTLFDSYIARMRVMAPKKPIIITQTGTTAQYNNTAINRAQKDQWLRDTYAHLAAQNGVLAILYYDYNLSSWECDWTVFNTPAGVAKFSGYIDAAANPAFSYLTPSQLSARSLVLP